MDDFVIRIIKNIKENCLKYFYLLITFSIFGFFIFSIWDKNYYIGGDFIYPLSPQNNIKKSIFIWEEGNNGFSFFGYVLLAWQAPFLLLSWLQIPSYLMVKIFTIVIYLLGFFASFGLFKLLHPSNNKKNNNNWPLLVAILFFLNPAAILVIVGTVPLYGIPICLFLILQFIDKKKIIYALLFSYFFNISFITDFPQVKFSIVFFFSLIFTLIYYIRVRQVKFKKVFFRLVVLGLLTIILNAYVVIPFIRDVFGPGGIYNYYSKEVVVYDGNADIFSASLPFTSRFFNSNLINKNTSLGKFLSSPFFIIWTFFLWFLIILNAFLVKKRSKKIKIYLLLTFLLFFIFLAKGSNPPFGEVYKFLLFHLPFFKIFRTTSSLIIGGVIFYTFLLGLTIKSFLKTKTVLLIIFCLIHFLVFAPVYQGRKLENWQGGSLEEKGYRVPEEYFKISQAINKFEDDKGKILSLPLGDGYVNKSWGYSGQPIIKWLVNKPINYANDVIGDNQINFLPVTKACLFTKIFNIGYLLQEKDSLHGPVVKNLDFSGNIIQENNYFTLREIDNNCFLPTLYIADEIIQIDSENPTDILNFNDFVSDDKKYSFYLVHPQIKAKSDLKAKDEFINKISDQKFIFSRPKNFTTNLKNNFIRRDLDMEVKGVVSYPYVRIKPNSFIYPLIRAKEQRSLKKNLTSREKFDLIHFYAAKRIAEIVKWGTSNTWWQKNLKDFEKIIEEVINQSELLDNKHEGLQLTINYVNYHKNTFNELANKEGWSNDKIIHWSKIFEDLTTRAAERMKLVDPDKLEYSLEVPENGEYELFIKPEKDFSGIENLRVSIDGLEKEIASESLQQKSLIDLGTIDLEEETSIKPEISINYNNLINNNNWRILIDGSLEMERNEVDEEELQTKENNPLLIESDSYFQNISNWSPAEVYLLEFDYEMEDNSAFEVYVKENIDYYSQGQWQTKEQTIRSERVSKGGRFSLLFKTNGNSLKGSIVLRHLQGKIKIIEARLLKMNIPSLMVKSKQSETDYQDKPLIHFKKINPTKYEVEIKNAQNPYMLVFSQKYNKYWKIYKKTNISLFKELFNISQKQAVPEEMHFEANSYANQWLIKPECVDNQKEYTLVVEYEPQRLLNIGFAISLVSIISVTMLASVQTLKDLRKRERRINE